MYGIAVLTDNGHDGKSYAECMKNYCTSAGIFPLVEIYKDAEMFFRKIQDTVPDLVIFNGYHTNIQEENNMKKRAFIIAMLACMVTATTGSRVNMAYGERVQTGESAADTNGAGQAAETTEIPIKPLAAKSVDENPYMAKSDSNIHHDCNNTDSTDEVLPVGIYSEINVSYEKTNANASPAIFFDTYGHAVVPFLGGLAIRDINAGKSMTEEAT